MATSQDPRAWEAAVRSRSNRWTQGMLTSSSTAGDAPRVSLLCLYVCECAQMTGVLIREIIIPFYQLGESANTESTMKENEPSWRWTGIKTLYRTFIIQQSNDNQIFF